MKLFVISCMILATSGFLALRSPIINKSTFGKLQIFSEPPIKNIDPLSPEKEVLIEESDEDKYKREKLAEIAEKKAQEVFVKRNTGKYECQACGYVYAESQGLPKRNVQPGTPFEEIENFRCPQCGASKKYFVPETETLSGFKQNLNYGFGGNAMTGDSKGLLIFGGLAFFFLLFMGGYLLE
jgi:rubredoxin